jgi:hypothetical protein
LRYISLARARPNRVPYSGPAKIGSGGWELSGSRP